MHLLITGATGFLGRQLIRQACQRGWQVTGLIRDPAKADALRRDGIAIITHDLAQPGLDLTAVGKLDAVIHTAAAVSDWGAWSEFEANTVAATRHLCAALTRSGAGRLVHVSTVGVYGQPRAQPVTEEHPFQTHGRRDYYRRSKIEAERVVWAEHTAHRLAVSVLRPAMMYGVGDRTFLPRLTTALRAGKLRFIGNPATTIPLVNVEDVAAATLAVAAATETAGEAYNVVNPERVTQREFFNTIAELSGLPPVTRAVPYPVARALGKTLETIARLTGASKPPPLTSYRAFLFGYPRQYDIGKLQRQLGWKPAVGFQEGIRQAIVAAQTSDC